MNQFDNPTTEESADREAEQDRNPAETPANDPSEGPGPRGNQDVDQDRVSKAEEDLDRTGN